MDRPISLDDTGTWPPELRTLATIGSREPACQTRFTSDLEPSAEISNAIDAVLVEHGVVVYHCTRLMDVEVEDIRANGLRAASAELLKDKVTTACHRNFLTYEQAEHIIATGVLNSADQRSVRTNELCAATNLHTIEVLRDGIEPYFQNWGGEITHFWQQSNRQLLSALRRVGLPTLIAIHYRPSERDSHFPELAKLVIGRWREHDDYSGEIHIRVTEDSRVPILGIWHPGDDGWPPEAERATGQISVPMSSSQFGDFTGKIAAWGTAHDMAATDEDR
ncbi:hypothetical protein ACTD5D_20895 [Nocardia takedensis]|uniref:hypothetical protein n=1 Tax=Nocardia takedensis TaxID=259390 RepID=UPI003F76D260